MICCLTESRWGGGHLVLASSSPRRRQLLRRAGVPFEVVPPAVEEPEGMPAGVSPAGWAEALAYYKARSVAESFREGWVLGADTVVSVGGELLGKPADRADAEQMLRRLGGTRHAVITGVALVRGDGRRRIASETTFVTMRRMSEAELQAYIASGEWAGKAGAYAIQETADRFVVGLEGSFSNVVGLPVELVGRLVAEVLGEGGGRGR